MKAILNFGVCAFLSLIGMNAFAGSGGTGGGFRWLYFVAGAGVGFGAGLLWCWWWCKRRQVGKPDLGDRTDVRR